MNTARSAGAASVPSQAVDHLRTADQSDKAVSTGDFGQGDLGAGLTDLLSADASAGLHAYFLVLLTVALLAARTLMSPLHGRVGTHGWGADGPRRGRSVPRSQWMIGPQ
jgi:hypothetical protein